MSLSPANIKELDRAVELRNKVDCEEIGLEKQAAELINSSKFAELNAKLKCGAEVSQVISKICVTGDDIKAAVTKACLEYIVVIERMVESLDGTIDVPELDSIFSKYEKAGLMDEADEYITSKALYSEEGGCLTHKMDAVSVIKHNGTAEPIEVSFMFKSEDLEPWMQEHTLVQDGHLMFIE